jgi:hypothetical protein
MKLITRGSYLRLTDQNACQARRIAQLERSQEMFDALAEKTARLREQLRADQKTHADALVRVQELTLLVGMKGFAVEMTPDTPATPARPGVLTLTKIQK